MHDQYPKTKNHESELDEEPHKGGRLRRVFGRGVLRSASQRFDSVAESRLEEPELISAADGRAISFFPGEEGDPMQRVRVLSRYGVIDKTGQRNLRTELIRAQTAVGVQYESVVVGNLTEALFNMGKEVEKGMTNPTNRAGRYVIEYPRTKREEPIRGAVYMLGRELMRYDFTESGDDITITGEQVVESPLEVIDTPTGTRVTASVSMDESGEVKYNDRELEKKYSKYVVNTKEPTPEEQFMQRIRTALATYRAHFLQEQ